MKHFLRFALFLSLAFSACKKDLKDHTLPTSSSNTYIPMTQGSYWLYDCYVVDSTGTSTFMHITDSVYIDGITVFGTDTFYVQHGTSFGSFSSPIAYLRDSSGYLINPAHRVLFSQTNFTDTLLTW